MCLAAGVDTIDSFHLGEGIPEQLLESQIRMIVVAIVHGFGMDTDNHNIPMRCQEFVLLGNDTVRISRDEIVSAQTVRITAICCQPWWRKKQCE
jgi:hypothetical protein